jgi:hypothetical protein
MKYVFADNSGIETTQVNLNIIQEILKQPVDYWKEGAGDCAVQVADDERLIFFKLKEGVFIMQHPDYLVPVTQKNKQALPLHHYVGGELFMVPSTSLCTSKQAYEIIRFYIETGGRLSDRYSWAELTELLPGEE